MIDEHGEAVYTDLLLHFRFDLAEWLAYERRGTVPSILAMLRNLPEGSRYSAAMSAPGPATDERPPLDPVVEAQLERQLWTADRRLMAQLINSLHTLIQVTGKWKEGEGPQFPVIGPASWREDTTPAASGPDNSVDATLHRLFGA